MDGRDWLAQARRGVLELCVLTLINREPRYGYEINLALARGGKALSTSEGTLYPLLRRLQRDSLVEATWRESREGPPRKYYRLTPAGHALLEAQLTEWDELVRAVSRLRVPLSLDDGQQDEDEEVPGELGSNIERSPALSRRSAAPPGAPARS